MSEKVDRRNNLKEGIPNILPAKRQSELITELLRGRLDKVLPLAMKEADLDMWIILCQEDDPDPIHKTMIPMDYWSHILQMLIFIDEGNGKIKGYNICGDDPKGLYERLYTRQLEEEQWPILLDLVEKKDPKKIGINIGSVKWCAGGLTHNLYQQLKSKLPDKYSERLVSAEKAAVRWGATLTKREIDIYRHVEKIAHHLIADCFSRKTIIPGVTTIEELVWHYWQRVIDLNLEIAFRPHFKIIRNQMNTIEHCKESEIILPGDVIHCDVGIKYLRLNTDNSNLAYVLKPGETEAPAGLRSIMAQTNRLQDIFLNEFREDISGNELLQNILKRAHKEGISKPKVNSHPLGLFLHQPGPLIGLPWEQVNPLPRGETLMIYYSSFSMELSTEGTVREWNGQSVRCHTEELVVFTKDGCHTLNERQTEYYLI